MKHRHLPVALIGLLAAAPAFADPATNAPPLPGPPLAAPATVPGPTPVSGIPQPPGAPEPAAPVPPPAPEASVPPPAAAPVAVAPPRPSDAIPGTPADRLSLAQPPAAGYSASKVGEMMIREELQHRSRMMEMTRVLELEQMQTKIAQTEAEKAHSESDMRKIKDADTIPIVPVQGGPRGPMAPNGAMANAQPIEVKEPPVATTVRFEGPSSVPRLTGTIGSRGVFRLSDEIVEAGVGEKVGIFVVRSVSANGVVLEDSHNASNHISLQVQM